MATLVSRLAMAAGLMVVCGLLTAGDFFSSCCCYCCSCLLSPCFFSYSSVLFSLSTFLLSAYCFHSSCFLVFFFAFFQFRIFTSSFSTSSFPSSSSSPSVPLSLISSCAVLNFLPLFYQLYHTILGAVLRFGW